MELKQTQDQFSEKRGMSKADWVIVTVGGAYIVLPVDLIPDMIPIAGWVDDFLAGIGTLTTVINSQLTQANTTLSGILKTIRFISFSLWGILGVLVLIFGALIYQLFAS